MLHDLDLLGFMEDRLPRKEKESVQQHLDTCSPCRAEYETLVRDRALFRAVHQSHPEYLCPKTDQWMAYMMDDVDAGVKKILSGHLEACAACREKTDAMAAAMTADTDSPDEAEWLPVPEAIRSRLTQSPSESIRKRLKEALFLLKQKAGAEMENVYEQVEALADKLMNGEQDPDPVFALERDITLPEQTDLILRDIDGAAAFEMELADFRIEFEPDVSGGRLTVTRAGIGVPGIKVTTGPHGIRYTDENGELRF